MGHHPTRVVARAPVSPHSEKRAFSFLRGRAGMLALIAAVLGGCGRTSVAREASHAHGDPVGDDAGRALRLTGPARRVVSLVPSITELISAMGGADCLVARTAFDRDTILSRLPSLGRTLDPSLEAIVALQPDVVFLDRDGGRGLDTALEGLGIPTYLADVQDLVGIYATIGRLGRILGAPTRGAELAADIRSELAEVSARAAGGPTPTVLFLVWHDPIVTAGGGTFIDQVISIAGGRNLFHDLVGWPTVSMENVIERDPDFIVLPRGHGPSIDPPTLEDLPNWRSLSAVRAGRVLVVDADLFYRPGPRVAEAARVLAGTLQGFHEQVHR